MLHVPITPLGCDGIFVRVSLLETHIEEVHRKDFGDYVSADAIAPLAKLEMPSSLASPSSFSCSPISQYTTVASVVPSKRRASQALLNGKEPLARRWSRINFQDEEEVHENIAFNDLSRLELSKTPDETVSVEVRKKLPWAQTQVSRPQRMICPAIRTDDVPDTILYGTFARQVKEFVANRVVKR